jgi:hypothetical protein
MQGRKYAEVINASIGSNSARIDYSSYSVKYSQVSSQKGPRASLALVTKASLYLAHNNLFYYYGLLKTYTASDYIVNIDSRYTVNEIPSAALEFDYS